MKRTHSVDTLFALLLYGLFALLSLLLILIGARVYTRIVRNTDTRSETRASLSYVTNKVRAGDEAGAVALETRSGLSVLVLRETAGERAVETLLYFYEGTLRELFQAADTPFLPANGEILTPLTSFSATLSGSGLLTLHSCGTDGQTHTRLLQLRTALPTTNGKD